MFNLENNLIYKTTNIKNYTKKEYYGTLVKTQIDITNLSAITFKWLKFDLEQGDYIEDTENTTPFQVDVAGQVVELPVGETIELTAEDNFTIKTINEGCSNDVQEVVIDEN